jgi:16S rRNA (cytidine1402-2'-O)-methyltransferase
MQRGEFVILIAGAEPTKNQNDISPEQEKLLTVLLKECSIKSAVAMAVEITGARKKILYQAALKLSNRIK